MTPYERGYAAALKAAAEVCRETGAQGDPVKHYACHDCADNILSLPIVGDAAGPSHECVMVPREPKKGLLCGDVAISTDPRYAGWVFVRHVDGINWTTGAKLTPETWAMLAAAEKQKARKG